MNVVPSKPNYLLEFHKHGKPVGTFDFDKDAMHFEGDLTESGKIFVDWVLGEFQERIDDAVQAEREAKDAAYKERNQLVALLSTCFPAGKAKTDIEGWDEAWHGCVYIDFPWGQASWHYHDSDAWMFDHLPAYRGQWDGHTTEQKYSAIAAAIRARGEKE